MPGTVLRSLGQCPALIIGTRSVVVTIAIILHFLKDLNYTYRELAKPYMHRLINVWKGDTCG